MPKLKTSVKLPIGEVIDLYYIKTFADRVGRDVQTIKRWHREHLIPDTFFHDKNGCKLYSDDMINVVKKAVALSQCKRGRRMDLSPFSPIVYKEWDKLKLKYTGKYNPQIHKNFKKGEK